MQFVKYGFCIDNVHLWYWHPSLLFYKIKGETLRPAKNIFRQRDTGQAGANF